MFMPPVDLPCLQTSPLQRRHTFRCRFDIFSLVTGWVAAALMLVGVTLSGCSKTPDRVNPPSIDAGAAALAAVTQYDTDGDGTIGPEELKSAPALRVALGNLDTSGDGAVSAEEVIARIEAWQKSKVGLTTTPCAITFNGRPLAGATVTFEPEEFLGDSIQACVGKTNAEGNVRLKIPGSIDNLPGCAPGLYRVKISSTNAEIPEKYNNKTILGAEVSLDSATVETGHILNLKK